MKCKFDLNEIVSNIIYELNTDDSIAILKELKNKIKGYDGIDPSQLGDQAIFDIADVLLFSGYNVSEEDIKTILLSNNPFEQSELEKDTHKIKEVEGDTSQDAKYDIASNYGAASDIYTRMKQDFKINLVKQALFNVTKNSRQGSTISEFNKGIQNFQETLYQDLINYVKVFGDAAQKKSVKNTSLYKNGKYTGNFENFQNIFEELLIPKGGISGSYLYTMQQVRKQYVDAYNAYIALLNFDNLISDIFGKNITINHNDGNFTADDNKYDIKAVNKLPSNWRTNDDIDAQKEMDQITTLLVTTFQIYSDQNTPQPNNYMNMQQFIYITSKIKSLTKSKAFQNTHTFKASDSYGNTQYVKYLSKDEIDLLYSKGIYNIIELIESIDDNPSLYWKLTIKYLSNWLESNYVSSLGKQWYPSDKSMIATLYKNVYSDDHSLNKIFLNEFNSSSNYYTYIVQAQTSISGLEYLRYQLAEEGKLIDITLHKSGSDAFGDYFERMLNSKYSKKSEIQHVIVQNKFDTQYSSGKIQYKLGELTVQYDPKNKTVQLSDSNITIKSENYIDYEPIIRQALSEVLGYDLTNEFFDTLSTIYSSNGKSNSGITNQSMYQDILKFMSDIIANDYFIHTFNEVKIDKATNEQQPIDKYESKTNLDSAANKFYGDNRLTNLIFRPASGEYGVFIKDMLPILNNLALAQSIVEGRTVKGTVKDADGNDLGNSSMSRLYTNLFNQLRVECRQNNSAVKDCSIVQTGLVKGTILSREFKGDTNKTATEFNPNESYFVSLMYDFLEKVADKDSESVLIQPCVVADKSMILKAVTDKNTLVSILKKALNIENNTKRSSITSFTSQEVWGLVASEFGKIYENIFDTIKTNWNTLNDFVSYNMPEYEGLIFDPFNNFEYFNNWCSEMGVKGDLVLENVLRKYQQLNPDDKLCIRQQIHYISVKGKFYFNPTLVSMLNRFNPSKLNEYAGESMAYARNKSKQIIKFNNTSLTSLDDFIKTQERNLIQDLVDNNFQIDLTNSNIPKAIQLFKNIGQEWIDKSVNKAYIAKVTVGTGKNKENVYIRSKKHWNSVINGRKKITNIELHPLISLHNAVGYFVGQEYIMTSMGISAINPAKATQYKYADLAVQLLDLAEESERYTMSTKRNVTLTGNMNRYIMGLLDGLPNEVKISILADVNSPTFNLVGDRQKATIFDGAIYTTGPVCYMQNNSLAGAAAGMDQKPLWHAYESDIASADIIKTASFGATNSRCQDSEFYQNLNRKGLDIRWDRAYDITKEGLNGIKNVPEEVYYKDLDGNIKVRTNLTFDEVEELYTYDEYTHNEYVQMLAYKAGNSDVKVSPTKVKMKIMSNYDVYLYLGGHRSVSKVGESTFKLSEASMITLANIINFTGQKKEGVDKITSSDDVIQPLKSKMIYYHVTEGAMKKGVGNINSTESYYDDAPLLYTNISMKMSGIQLDKTHEADGAHLSIMTQVINSLGSRGYTEPQANRVYKALQAVTELVIKDELGAYKEHLGISSEFKNDIPLRKLMASLMVKQLANSTTDETTMAKAVVSELIDIYNKGIDLKNLPAINLPVSDPAIFNKFVATIASSLSKTAIKLKFDGLLSVLNPSHTIFKVFGDKLLSEFNSKVELLDLQIDSFKKPLDSSKLNIGTTYYKETLIGGNKVRKLITINSPEDYWRERLNSSDEVTYYEAICSVETSPTNFVVGKEYVRKVGNKYQGIIYTRGMDTTDLCEIKAIGRDLNTYNIYFTGDDDKQYSMWDLAIVQEMYIKDSKTTTVEDREKLQKQLNAIATESESIVTVADPVLDADGKIIRYVPREVKISANSVKVQCYENILSQMYKSKFGLDPSDSVSEISKLDKNGDPIWFIEKMKSVYESKTSSVVYDLELQKLNGKHTYLIHSNNIDASITALRKAGNRKVISENGRFWFTDGRGNKYKEASSAKDTIYYDANNIEIIVTDNLGFYLENEEYFNINISANTNNYASEFNGEQGFLSYLYDLFTTIDTELTKEAIEAYKLSDNIGKKFTINKKSTELTEEVLNDIHSKARRMYTSYMMSLNTLAARIPSQSMQSFMAMKTVGYDRTGINSVYVNPYQIWLQGSDFDIDTVSMLGYSFSDSGEFLHWSPFADFSNTVNLEASIRIPFPTGVQLENISAAIINSEGQNTNELQDLAIDDLLSMQEQINNKQFNSKQDVYRFARALQVLSDYIQQNNGTLNTSKVYNKKAWDFVKKVLNRHNTYITKTKSRKKIENITKNYISATMFDIIKNPINLIQAQSPIDKAVDEFKDITKNSKSPKIEKDKTRNTPGNFYNHGVELFNNMAGKTVTGIAAAGLKALLGVTHATNLALNTEQGVENVMFFKKIGDGVYQIVANAFSENSIHYTITNQDILNALNATRNTQDAVLILSALLSLATDNAKELQLSKLNATEELASLYIAGITIGMDLTELANLMMSDVMEGLLSIMRGNIFLEDRGLPRFQQAIDYVQTGPSALYDKVVKQGHLEVIRDFVLSRHMDLGISIGDLQELKEFYVQDPKDGTKVRAAYAGDVKQILAYPGITWTNELVQDLFKKLKPDDNDPNNNEKLTVADSVDFNRFLEDLEQWLDIKMLTQNSKFNDLLELNEIGSELTQTTTLQGINQGLDTTRDDIIKYRSAFEDLIQKKYVHSKNDVLQERFLNTKVDSKLLESIMNMDHKLFEELQQKANDGEILIKHVFSVVAHLSTEAHKEYNTYKANDYSISLTGFLNDEVYRNRIISLFNLIKGAVNVPFVIFNNQHYRGYLEVFDVMHHSLLASSYKYRELTSRGLQAIGEYNFDSKERSKAVRKVEKFLDTHIINQWLQRQGLLTVPEGVVIVDESLKPFETKAPVQIQLGTLQGNLSFKTYFENYIIPDLKKGIIGKRKVINEYGTEQLEEIINYKGTDFIKALNYELYDRTVDQNAISILALPIDMSPKTDLEHAQLSWYKESFNRLRSVTYYEIPVLNLLLYYNMIIHGNSNNSNSLLPLFTTLKMDNNFEKLNDYYKFVSEIDRDNQVGKDYDFERLVMELAPTKSLYKFFSKDKPVIGRGNDDLEYKLWKWKGWYTIEEDETGEKTKVRRQSPYVPYTANKLEFQHIPQTNLLPTNGNSKVISVGPGYSVTLKVEEDKIIVSNITRGHMNMKAKDLEKYIKKYNEKHGDVYGIGSISDLIIYEGNKVNLELTWESIDRLFNDPC